VKVKIIWYNNSVEVSITKNKMNKKSLKPWAVGALVLALIITAGYYGRGDLQTGRLTAQSPACPAQWLQILDKTWISSPDGNGGGVQIRKDMTYDKLQYLLEHGCSFKAVYKSKRSIANIADENVRSFECSMARMGNSTSYFDCIGPETLFDEVPPLLTLGVTVRDGVVYHGVESPGTAVTIQLYAKQ